MIWLFCKIGNSKKMSISLLWRIELKISTLQDSHCWSTRPWSSANICIALVIPDNEHAIFPNLDSFKFPIAFSTSIQNCDNKQSTISMITWYYENCVPGVFTSSCLVYVLGIRQSRHIPCPIARHITAPFPRDSRIPPPPQVIFNTLIIHVYIACTHKPMRIRTTSRWLQH